MAVYAELHRPTLARFGLVTFFATVICTILYSLTGSYGYLTFRPHVQSDILVNYHPDNALAISARVFIVLVVFSTFAICQFVGRYVCLVLYYPGDLKTQKSTGISCQMKIKISTQTTKFLMIYNILCFQISYRLIIFFT